MKNRLLNLLEANRERGAGLRAQDGDDEATIYVYDAIGGYFGIDAQDFAATLSSITAPTIHLRINSPGGDIFDARSMQTLIAQHPARVIAHVDGLAASAASFLMTAANEIRMSDGAFLMIHKGWTMMVGNADDFTEMANVMAQLDDSIAATYAAKTGKDKSELMGWMAAETWFNAQEARKNGFIDEIDEITPAAASAYDLSAFANAPAEIAESAANEQWSRLRAKQSRQIGLIEARA